MVINTRAISKSRKMHYLVIGSAIGLSATLAPWAVAGLTDGKYSGNQVWDAQRSPAYPSAGSTFTVRGFKSPYSNIDRKQYTLKSGQYVQFFYVGGTCTGDNVGIRLYNSDDSVDDSTYANGVVSSGGSIYGLGPALLHNSVPSGYGTVVTNDQAFEINGSFTYEPYTGKATCAEIDAFVANTVPQEVGSSPQNNPPTAVSDSFTTLEDAAIAIDVLSNDTDPDDGDSVAPASIALVSNGINGTAKLVDGGLVYTPNANFNGTDSFSYTVNDQSGETSNVASVTITVTSVNDRPVINSVAITEAWEDTPYSYSITGEDAEGDSLTWAAADGNPLPTWLSLASEAPAPTVFLGVGTRPATNMAYDSTDGTEAVQTTIFANSLSHAGNRLYFSEQEEYGIRYVDDNGLVQTFYAGNGDYTTFQPLGTAFDVASNKMYASFYGQHKVVQIDDQGNMSDLSTSINYFPKSLLLDSARQKLYVATRSAIYEIDLNNTDPTSNARLVVGDGAFHGSYSDTGVASTSLINTPSGMGFASNGDLIFAEQGNHIIRRVDLQNDTISTLAGSQGTNSNTGDGGLAVDATLSNPAGLVVNSEDTIFVIERLNKVVRKIDSQSGEITELLDLKTVQGNFLEQLTLTSDGTLYIGTETQVVEYRQSAAVVLAGTPPQSAVGNNQVCIVASDGTDTSEPQCFNVNVAPVNDAPTVSVNAGLTLDEGETKAITSSLLAAADVDDSGAGLVFTVTTLPSHGVLFVDANQDGSPSTGETLSSNGTFTQQDIDNDLVLYSHDGSETTSDVFGYSLADGGEDEASGVSGQNFAITVLPVNDAPMIGGMPVGLVDEDGTYSFTPSASDMDAGDNLTYSAQNLPSWASIDPQTGEITGTPTNDDVGIFRDIIVTVSDGTTTTSLPAFSLTVANTNDTPTAAADSYTLAEGDILQTIAETGVLANDSDEDVSDVLTATLVTGPTRAGNFTLNEDGSFSYRHNGSETRSDSFTYALSDGTVTLPATTVSFTITAANDAPRFVSSPNILSVTQGERFEYTPLTSDPDSVTNLALTTAPSWLSLQNGLLSGTAPYSVAGEQAIDLTVEDQEFVVTQSFTVTVAEANTTVVSLATGWVGLPLTVGKSAQLAITLTHEQGPALTSGELQVTLSGSSANSQMAGCINETSGYRCAFDLADGASDAFTLAVTPASAGDLVMNLQVRDAVSDTLLTSKITDVSVQPAAVQQSNNKFTLANATALASLNITEDADKELIAGTSLGNDVKLLEYAVNQATATVFGSINNTGETKKLIVADVDNNTLRDVLVVNTAGDATMLYYNMGDATFAADAASEELPYATDGLLSDLNGDGLPELILGGDGFNLYIYENLGGVFSQAPFVFTSPTAVEHFALLKRSPSSAPLSGTLTIASRDAVQLVRFSLSVPSEKAQARGQLKLGNVQTDQVIVGETIATLPLANVTALKVQDLNNDGDEELVISTAHSDTTATSAAVNIVTVTGGTSLTQIASLGTASAKGVDIADFNGDGTADILVTNTNDSYQFFFGKSGSATEFEAQETMIFNPSTLVLPEDVDNDGQVDVMIYEEANSQMNLYLSQSNGVIGQSANLSVSATATNMSNSAYQWQYVATVTNPASEAIDNVTLTFTLPTGISVASKPAVCAVASSSVTCAVDSMPTGSEAFSFVLSAASKPTGSVTATVASDALDNDTTNNAVTTEFTSLFTSTQVRVDGGGKSGGSFGWLAILISGLLLLRNNIRNNKLFRNTAFTCGKKVVAMLSVLGISLSSHADDAMFVEANLGRATSHWNASGLKADMQNNAQEITIMDLDDERGTQELLIGYRFMPMLAVEIGYRDWGEISYGLEGVASDPAQVLNATQNYYPASGKGAFIGLRASYWHGDNLEGYAKFSAWDWSGDYRTFINNEAHTFETGDTDIVASIGMNGYFFERYSAGVVYQTVRLEGQRNAMVGFSLGVKF